MDLKKIQARLEHQLELLGFELLHLESVKEGRDTMLRLYLDHLKERRPVTLDDCTQATEGLLAWMDVEFPNLREEVGLEVSSPGLERPLVKPAHFQRFQGSLCRIQTQTPIERQKRFKGWICGCTDTEVTIEEDGKLKQVPLELIQKARLAPFDEAGTPPAKYAAPAADLESPTQADVEKSVD